MKKKNNKMVHKKRKQLLPIVVIFKVMVDCIWRRCNELIFYYKPTRFKKTIILCVAKEWIANESTRQLPFSLAKLVFMMLSGGFLS